MPLETRTVREAAIAHGRWLRMTLTRVLPRLHFGLLGLRPLCGLDRFGHSFLPEWGFVIKGTIGSPAWPSLRIGVLAVVLVLDLQSPKLPFELLKKLLGCGSISALRVMQEVILLVWVIRNIEQFVDVFAPVINQLVRRGPDSVMGCGIVVSRVVVVPIVNRLAPIARR